MPAMLVAEFVGNEVREIIEPLVLEIKRMSATLDDLNAKIAALQKSATDAEARVSAAQTALQAAIDDLKAHPASPDLTAQVAALDAVNATLSGIDPAAPATPAPATPAP